MHYFRSSLLKPFPKEGEVTDSVFKTQRKGRYGAFLIFAGVALITFVPFFKGVTYWYDKFQSQGQSKSFVELISNQAEITNIEANNPNKSPIQPDPSFLREQTVAVDKLPTRILIPSLNIDLPITPSKVVGGYWEISEKTASFGLGSNLPGEAGNSVIFAHARDGLFLSLRKIKKDAFVYILTNKDWYSYQVEDTKLVKPTEIEVIAPTGFEILTLYTCSGFADTKRLIVKAKRILTP